MDSSDVVRLYIAGWSVYRIHKQSIALGMNLGKKPILRFLREANIPLRDTQESKILIKKQRANCEMLFPSIKIRRLSQEQKDLISLRNSKLNISKQKLYELYVENEFSLIDMGKMFGLSRMTIGNRLRKYGIPTRVTDTSKHTDRARKKIIEARARQDLEKGHPRLGCKNSEEQKRKYKETCKIRGISMEGKDNPMYGKHHTKKTKEIISRMHKKNKTSVGEKNPNWKGGIANLPYPTTFDKDFKIMIRNREGNKCFNCGISEEDAKEKYKQNLHIHHIDYNKMNTLPNNCCALCCPCNIKANYGREAWTKFFRNKMEEEIGFFYASDHRGVIAISIKDDKNQILNRMPNER